MNIQMERTLVLLSFLQDFQLKKLSWRVRRVIMPEIVENAARPRDVVSSLSGYGEEGTRQ